MDRIAVIGGGMSGMIAAITAAKNGHEVTILERQERIGKKILLTGNGRCNLSNTNISSNDYLTDSIPNLEMILNSFQEIQEQKLLSDLGILTKIKNNGIYPFSNQASSVLDTLRIRIKELNIKVRTDCYITKIIHSKASYQLEIDHKKDCESFSKLIIATGGLAGVYHESEKNGNVLLSSLGHQLIESHPALVQTICADCDLKSINGVRSDAYVTLRINNSDISKEFGELQITEKGLSGIVVFQLTRYMNPKKDKNTELIVDFFPNLSKTQILDIIHERYQQYGNRTLEEFFIGLLHKKLILYFLKKNHLNASDIASYQSEQKLEQVLLMMKSFSFQVLQLNHYSNAQISTGGVRLSEINPNTMSSINDPNIYITGEALNVSGACGGYNLHFAMASGYIAGKSI